MIKILCYRGRSLISKAIQLQTRSPYSHIAVEVSPFRVYEAWHVGGVRRLSSAMQGHTPGTEIDRYSVEGDYNEDQVREYLNSQLGKGYDFWAVARFVSRRRSPDNDNRLFCSEYALNAFAAGGLPLLHGRSSELSPRDVALSPYLFKMPG